MKKLSSAFVCLAVSTLAFGGLAWLAPSALAGGATNGTTHCDPSAPDCNQNPVLSGPAPQSIIPSNCPTFLTTDSWALNFVSGNSVSHGTSNKNGDWGGGTAQGQAELTTSDGTVQYAGHLTEWGGGGNNAGGQTEGGFTLTFNGSGIAGNLSIHVDGHQSTNNSGTPTANHMHVNVTCS